jgi:hypothetical protein
MLKGGFEPGGQAGMERRRRLVHVITVHRRADGIRAVAWSDSDISHFLYPTESPTFETNEELTEWVSNLLLSLRRHRVSILLSPALRSDATLLGAVTQAVGKAQAPARRRSLSAAAR